MSSYHSQIMKLLMSLPKRNGTSNPELQSNSHKSIALGEYFLWSTVEKFARTKKEELETAVIEEGDKRSLSVGGHIVYTSKHFVLSADVSEPVKRFDEGVLVSALNASKYRIPAPIVKEFIASAKVPGKSRVILKVSEKGM